MKKTTPLLIAILLLIVTAIALIPHGTNSPDTIVSRRVFVEIENRVARGQLEGMGRVRPAAPTANQAAVVIAGQTELGDATSVVAHRFQAAAVPAQPAIV